MKKLGLVGAGIVFLLLILGYMNYSTKERTVQVSSLDSREITMFHYFSNELSGGLNEMIETVNTFQKDYKVIAHALDHEAFKSMIHTTLSKGNPPELFTYWAGAKVKTLVDQNLLESIDDIWKNEEFDSYFSAAVRDSACSYNQKKYLLPISQHFVLFFFNKNIFKQYKIQPPTTWEEFLAACQRLKKADITPISLGAKERWPAQFWFDYLLLRTAGPEYRSRLMNGTAAYTDEAVKNAYQIWAGLIKKGYFNTDADRLDWAQASELMATGASAMTLMGTWAIQLFEAKYQMAEASDYDIFVFPMIRDDIPKTALGPIDGIVLTKDSKNHDFAKKVLSYFAQMKPQKKMSKGSGALAPNLKVPKSDYSPLKQRIINEIENSPFWAFNYDLATPPSVAEYGMDSFLELIQFPDQYVKILENLDKETREEFIALSN